MKEYVAQKSFFIVNVDKCDSSGIQSLELRILAVEA
jgi:hypothetical protein